MAKNAKDPEYFKRITSNTYYRLSKEERNKTKKEDEVGRYWEASIMVKIFQW